MTDNRKLGVTFGDLSDDLESESYPVSTADLLAAYGERELIHANGSVTLAELLEPIGEESYRSAAGVEQAVLNMISGGAEGRRGYTDRGIAHEEIDFQQESF